MGDYLAKARSVPKVMNPALFSLLTSRFGPVRIANPLEPAAYGSTFVTANGHRHTRLVVKGEHYQVNCPYCGDRRSRLYVNHLYGTNDPATGKPMRGLVYCFNADCLSDPRNIQDFESRLFGWKNRYADEYRRSAAAAVRAAEENELGPDEGRVFSLPGECVTVDTLDRTHPAVQYLEDRGFDPVELGRDWSVSYCQRCTGWDWLAEGRLVIPVLRGGEVHGWQARYLGEIDWKAAEIPKYYFPKRFAKARYLYNQDQANKHPVVVACEGVTDAWTIGPEAVALFGKTVSHFQLQELRTWAARGGGVVLLLDPDARLNHKRGPEVAAEKWRLMTSHLREELNGKLAVVELPEGRDPAQYGRPILRSIVAEACRTAGLPFDSAESRNPCD